MATEPSAVAAAFEEIKRRAGETWREPGPDRPYIMVGTATCGRAAGALTVLEALEKDAKAKGFLLIARKAAAAVK